MSEETPVQLREQLDTLEKELTKTRKSNEELAKENRGLKARDAFRGAELSPELADLFVAASPDAEITVDSVKEFATKYNIGAPQVPEVPAGGEQPKETVTPNTQGLEQVARAGSGAGQGGQPSTETQVLSSSEFVDLLRTDKAAAQAALAKGLVKVRDDNPLARDRVNTGDRNPFEQFNRDALKANQS